MRNLILTFSGIVALATWSRSQSPIAPDPNTPRPIGAADTLFIEDMTWNPR